MVDHIIGTCSDCGQVYAIRKYDDKLVVPTADGKCRCGSEQFTEVTDTAVAQ